MSNTAAIIEARMTSSRLPGKHLLQADGTPVILHLLNRIARSRHINNIIAAITDRAEDDVLAEVITRSGYNVYRGSEDNVMLRVLEAAEAFEVQTICEITGDCPLVDISLVDQAIDTFISNECMYVNNGKLGLPDGMNCQVFSTNTLRDSFQRTSKLEDWEHVTLHIKRHPELYTPIYIPALDQHRIPGLRLTLDYQEDYILIKKIIESFAKSRKNELFGLSDIISLIRANPALANINSCRVNG